MANNDFKVELGVGIGKDSGSNLQRDIDRLAKGLKDIDIKIDSSNLKQISTSYSEIAKTGQKIQTINAQLVNQQGQLLKATVSYDDETGEIIKKKTQLIQTTKSETAELKKQEQAYKAIREMSAKNKQDSINQNIKESNSLLSKQQSEYKAIWDINAKIASLNPNNNTQEISALEQQKKYHQENFVSLQKQIESYSGIVNNEQRVNSLLDIQKKAQLDINNIKAKQADKDGLSNQQQIVNIEKAHSQAISENIKRTKDKFLATEQAYKANQKMAESMSIVKTRAESASTGFNAYLKSLKPKALRDYSDLINKVSNSFNVAAKSGKQIDLTKANSQLGLFKSHMKDLGLESKSFSRSISDNINKFAQWTISATTLMTAINSVKAAISNVHNMDEQITNLRMVTGDSVEETQKLVNSYNELAQELGATTTEVTKSANEWLRQGKTVSETNTLIANAMILSKVAQLDSAEATQYLTSAMKGYGIEAQNSLSIIDKLTSIDIESATSAGGLAEAMSKTASSAELAGVSMDRLLGYIATVGEVTQKEMSSIGESFKTIFARMGNVKLGSLTDEDGNDMTKEISDVETILNKVDIKLRDSATSFRNFDEVLDDVGNNWSSFTEIEQSAIATTFAGVRQRENFIVLMENYSNALKYSETATSSAGTAMEKFGYYQESAQAKSKELTSSLESLAMNTLDSSLIKGFLDVSAGIVKFADASDILKVALIALATVGIAYASKAIIAYGVDMAGLIASEIALTGATGALATAQTVLNTVMTMNPIGAFIMGVVALTAVIKGVAAIYDHFNVTLEETQAKLEEQRSKYEKTTNDVEKLKDELESCKKKLEELNSIGGASVTKDGEQKKLENQTAELQRQLDIAKEKQRIEGLDTEKTATKSLNTKIDSKYDAKMVYSEFGSHLDYKEVTRPQELERTMYEYDQLALKYEQLEKVQQKLANSNKGNTKEFKNNEKELSSLSSKMDETRKYANDLADGMQTESDSLIGATKAGDETKKSIEGVLNSYPKWLDKINNVGAEAKKTNKEIKEDTSDAISSLFSEAQNTEIDNFQSSLSTLSDALAKVNNGEMTDSGIVDLLQQFPELEGRTDDLSAALQELIQDKLQALIESLKSAGADESIIQLFKNMAKDATTVSTSLSDLMDNLSGYQSLMQQVNEEVKAHGDLSLDTLNSILNKYPELEGVVSQYNAGLLSTQDVLDALAKAYKSDVDRYKQAVVAKNQYSESFWENVVDNLPSWVTNLSKAYKIDFDKFKNLSEAKMAIQKQFFTQMSIANTASAASLAAEAGAVNNASAGYKQAQEALKKAKELKKILNGLDTTANGTVNFSNYSSSGTGSSGSKGAKATKEIIDWIARKIDVLTSKIAKFKKLATDVYSTSSNQNKQLDLAIKYTKNLVSIQEKYYKSAMKQASNVKLSDSLKKKVREGSMDITQYSGDTAEKIKEYQKWYDTAQEVKNKIIDLKNEERELAKQRIDNIIDDYEKKVALYDSNISQRESKISIANAKGGKASASDYSYLIAESKKQSSALSAEYKKVNAEFQKLIKNGTIKKGNDDWYEYSQKLADIKAKMDEVTEATINYQNEAQKLKWDKFDDKVGAIDTTLSEIDQLIKGTKEGSDARNLLLREGFEQAQEKSAKLRKEIDALNKQYAKDKNNTIYKERLSELTSELYSAVDAMQSYNDALVESIKIRFDDQIEGLEKERDAWEDLINAQKKALQQEKKNHDYQKSIAEKTESISNVEARIAELEKAAKTGDRNALKEKEDLEDDLADHKEDLEEAQYDHSIELQEDALDKAIEDYNKAHQAKVDAIKSLYDKEQELIRQTANLTTEEFKKAFDEINAYAKANNLTVSAGLKDALNNKNSSSSNPFAELRNKAFASNADSSENILHKKVEDLLKKSAGKGGDNGVLNKYVKSIGYRPLSFDNMNDLGSVLGVKGEKVITTSKNGLSMITTGFQSASAQKKLLVALKKAGFSDGGTIGSYDSNSEISKLIKMSGEDVLVPAKTGEGVLTNVQNQAWLKLVPQLVNLSNMLPNINIPNSSNVTTNNSSPIVNLSINIAGNADSSTVSQLKSTGNDIINQLYNVMRKS